MPVGAVQPSNNVTGASRGDVGYVVKSGDTLWDIARAHGVSLAALEQANPQISNPDLIRPGQHVTIPSGGGGAGGVSGPTGAGAGGPAGNVFETAQKYLGQNASSLKGDTRDALPMNPNVPSNICCANFVSAVLTEAGQLPANLHTDSVATLNATLRSRGWTEVSPAQAKPGDVVIIQGGGVSHTEIYAGDGKMIGSNNSNADGSQKVGYNNLSWALGHGAKILRAPAGASGPSSSGATGASGATGPAPTGAGSRSQKIDQAIGFFQNQGWSRAQAIGIVANLDAESGMDAGINQIGGGPGYGLAQWEGPRQADFKAWAGHDIHGSSFDEQLRFVQYELTHSNSAAGNALKGATNPGDAASIVCRLYERPADSAGEAVRRAQRANDLAR